ncbi:unnamed protein product [Schistosoma turkestanicum]|nr:unnamed protein product [Schistosoma turkestanicum]
MEAITPPISARLRSANGRQAFDKADIKLTTIPLRPKDRKSVVHRNQMKENGTYHNNIIVESNGVSDVLNNHHTADDPQNVTENTISETPVPQPMTSSRFCSTM